MLDNEDERLWLGDEPPEFISAPHALSLAAGRCDDEGMAARAICDWLMADLIMAQCRRVTLEPASIGFTYSADDDWFPVSKLVPVDGAKSYVGSRVADDWNWEFGNFSWWFLDENENFVLAKILGAKFERSAIEYEIDEALGPLAETDAHNVYTFPANTSQQERVVTANDRDAECRRVAEILDNKKIRIGEVRSYHIANLWNSEFGKQVKTKAVTAFMEGGKPGRPKGP